MLGFAFSNALIATCVCWPSVPNPDSANTMVCLALAATLLLELPELHPAAARPTAAAATTASILDLLDHPTVATSLLVACGSAVSQCQLSSPPNFLIPAPPP